MTEAISDLQVQGELQAGDQVIDDHSVKVTYVPSNSSRRAGMYFQNDPQEYKLVVTPSSYLEP